MQAHLRALALTRLQDISILGRLVTNRRLQVPRGTAGSLRGYSPAESWLARQLQEIGSRSHTTARTPRLFLEYQNNDGISSTEETERHPSLNQTSLGQTDKADPSCNPQPDNENPSSNIRDLSGSIIYTTPTLLQESDGEIGCRLGSSSTIRSSKPGRTAMVVHEHAQMERPIFAPLYSHANNVCRCQQHGMGMQLEQSACTRLLDSGGSSTVNQLARTKSGLLGPQDIPSTRELVSTDSNGQYDQSVLHQQEGWYSLLTSPGISYGSLDLVYPTQDYAVGSTHTRCAEYDRGFQISSPILQESMADQTASFPTDSSSLGSLHNRSLCRQDDEIIAKLRVLDAGSRCSLHGCVVLPMDEDSTSLRKSPLESHHSGPTQDHSRAASLGNSGDTLLAECPMVPGSTATGSFPSLNVAPTNGSNDIPQDSPPSTTAQLDALRVEIIRNQLVRKNLNAQAVEDFLAQRLANNATNKLYRKNQLRFLEWATHHNVSYTFFTPTELVNFLADMRQEHSLQASTLKTLRAAVAHLHDGPISTNDSQIINSYIDTIMKQAPPLNIHRPTIDVSPALAFTRSIPYRATTPIKRLQEKLAFLLAMAAFLRPSDLTRIPFDSCSISDTGCLKFQVVSPKETRGKRRIIKPFTVHPHDSDIELCPVHCFKAVRDHPNLAFRPPGSQLFIKSNNINQPLSSSTISTWLHRDFINLCTNEPGISIRSLASSRALDLGVPMDNIVALGNWTSSDTFVNHYQRNQMAQVDFTSTVLSASSPEDLFFDANDIFSLD